MRRTVVGLLSLTLASGLGVGASGSAWAHAPGSAPGALAPATARTAPDAVARGDVHDLPSPLESKRRALRQEALTDVIDGGATAQQRNGSTVVKVGRSAASHPSDALAARPPGDASRGATGPVRRAGTGEDRQDLRDPRRVRRPAAPDYPDQDTDPTTPGPATFDGPLHNQIPEPDRTMDNSTVWQADYNRGPLPGPLLRHGPGRRVAEEVLRDAVLGPLLGRRRGHRLGQGAVQRGPLRPQQRLPVRLERLQQHLGPGPRRRQPRGSPTSRRRAAPTRQIKADLQSFDQWDRYDFDGDGNFNEPDGYIDHFQIVHAGGDQADGDPYQGEDAIWSHRWYAFARRGRHDRPGRQPARRHPDRQHRHLGRRLHDPAGERRPRRLRARVRPRPRPAGPLRHQRRRRQHHRATGR